MSADHPPCIRRHALMVGDGASSHKIDYVSKFKEILNLEGHQNRITGSRVTAILLNGWTLPIGEAASGRVCACSLRSRLVLVLPVCETYKLVSLSLHLVSDAGW